MMIIFQSQLQDSSGFGRAARQYYRILKNICRLNKWELKVLNIATDRTTLEEHSIWEESEQLKTREEINSIVESGEYYFFFHSNLNFASRIKSTYVLSSRSKRNFCITVWEANHIHPHWEEFLESIGCYDVIVPSNWNKNVFKKSMPDFKIHYVPHYDDNELVYENKQHKFLSISQDIPRKNWVKTVRAFYHAFHDMDIEFIIKTNGNLQAPTEVQNHQAQQFMNMIVKEKKNFPNAKCKIRLFYSVISDNKLEELYKEATHYFSMTYGEGFGLGMLEAKSRGLIIVAPDKGGHIDFCDENDFLFNSREEFVVDEQSVFPRGSTWFDSTVLDASVALKNSLKNNRQAKVAPSFKYGAVLNKFKELIDE